MLASLRPLAFAPIQLHDTVDTLAISDYQGKNNTLNSSAFITKAGGLQ